MPQPYQELAVASYQAVDDDDSIDLRQLWGVILRRKGIILLATAFALFLALILTYSMTPIYRGTLLLQIDREEGQVLDYKSVTPEEANNNSTDFYQTQYELLKSRSLARRVIDQMGLQLIGQAPRARAHPLS